MADDPLRINLEVNTADAAKLKTAAEEIAVSVKSLASTFLAGGTSAKDIAAATLNFASNLVETNSKVIEQVAALETMKAALSAAKAEVKETTAGLYDQGVLIGGQANYMKQLATEVQNVSVQEAVFKEMTSQVASSLAKQAVSTEAAGTATSELTAKTIEASAATAKATGESEARAAANKAEAEVALTTGRAIVEGSESVQKASLAFLELQRTAKVASEAVKITSEAMVTARAEFLAAAKDSDEAAIAAEKYATALAAMKLQSQEATVAEKGLAEAERELKLRLLESYTALQARPTATARPAVAGPDTAAVDAAHKASQEAFAEFQAAAAAREAAIANETAAQEKLNALRAGPPHTQEAEIAAENVLKAAIDEVTAATERLTAAKKADDATSERSLELARLFKAAQETAVVTPAVAVATPAPVSGAVQLRSQAEAALAKAEQVAAEAAIAEKAAIDRLDAAKTEEAAAIRDQIALERELGTSEQFLVEGETEWRSSAAANAEAQERVRKAVLDRLGAEAQLATAAKVSQAATAGVAAAAIPSTPVADTGAARIAAQQQEVAATAAVTAAEKEQAAATQQLEAIDAKYAGITALTNEQIGARQAALTRVQNADAAVAAAQTTLTAATETSRAASQADADAKAQEAAAGEGMVSHEVELAAAKTTTTTATLTSADATRTQTDALNETSSSIGTTADRAAQMGRVFLASGGDVKQLTAFLKDQDFTAKEAKAAQTQLAEEAKQAGDAQAKGAAEAKESAVAQTQVATTTSSAATKYLELQRSIAASSEAMAQAKAEYFAAKPGTDAAAAAAREYAAALRNLTAQSAEASIAQKDLSGAIGQIDKTVAYGSGRILAWIAGMGQAGFAIARLAAQVPGLTAIFSAIFPIVLAGAFIEILVSAEKKLEEWADQEQKAADEAAKFEREMNKSSEAVDRMNEKLAGQIGPLAEIAVRMADAGKKAVDLSQQVEALNKHLADQPGMWTHVSEGIGKAWIFVTDIFRSESVKAAREIDIFSRKIMDSVHTANDLPKAIGDINTELAKLQARLDSYTTGQWISAEQGQIDKIKEGIDSLTKLRNSLQETYDAEVTLATKADLREEQAKLYSEQKRLGEENISFQENQAKVLETLHLGTAEDEYNALVVLNAKKAALEQADVSRRLTLLKEEQAENPTLKLGPEFEALSLERQGIEIRKNEKLLSLNVDYNKRVIDEARSSADALISYDTKVAESALTLTEAKQKITFSRADTPKEAEAAAQDMIRTTNSLYEVRTDEIKKNAAALLDQLTAQRNLANLPTPKITAEIGTDQYAKQLEALKGFAGQYYVQLLKMNSDEVAARTKNAADVIAIENERFNKINELRKKELEVALGMLEDQAAGEKAIYDKQVDDAKIAFEERKISGQEYYSEVITDARRNLDLQKDILLQEVADERAALAQGTITYAEFQRNINAINKRWIEDQKATAHEIDTVMEAAIKKEEEEIRTVSNKISQDFVQMANKILTTHISIGKAAEELGRQLELYIIDQGIKTVVGHYATQLLQLLADHSSFLASLLGIQTSGNAAQIAAAKATEFSLVSSDAGIAGAAAYASVLEALPFPINVATAPGVAASAVGQTESFLAFAEGGGVGEKQPVLVHSGEVITHQNTINALNSPASSTSNQTMTDSHAMTVEYDQVTMLSPGMVVVPKVFAGDLAGVIATRGGTVEKSEGTTPPSGIREIPQRLPSSMASTLTSVILANKESTSATSGGATFEKTASAREGYVLMAREGFVSSTRDVSSAREGFVSSSRDTASAREGYVSSAREGFVLTAKEGFFVSAREGLVSSRDVSSATSARDGFVSSSRDTISAKEGYALSAREGFIFTAKEGYSSSTREISAAERGFVITAREGYASERISSARDGFAASQSFVSAKEGFVSSSREVSSAKDGFVLSSRDTASARDGYVLSARDGFIPVSSAKEGFVSTTSLSSARDGYTVSAKEGFIVSARDGFVSSSFSAKEGFVSSASAREGYVSTARDGFVISAKQGAVSKEVQSAQSIISSGTASTATGFIHSASHSTTRHIAHAKEGYVFSAREGFVTSSIPSASAGTFIAAAGTLSSQHIGSTVSPAHSMPAHQVHVVHHGGAPVTGIHHARDGFVISAKEGFLVSAREGFVTSSVSREIATARDGFVMSAKEGVSTKHGFGFGFVPRENTTQDTKIFSSREGFVFSAKEGVVISAKGGFGVGFVPTENTTQDSKTATHTIAKVSSGREGYVFSARDGLVLSTRDVSSAKEGSIVSAKEGVTSAREGYIFSARDGFVSSTSMSSAREGYVISARDGMTSSSHEVMSAKEGLIVSARDGLVSSSGIISAKEGLVISAKEGFVSSNQTASTASAREGLVLSAREGYVFSARDGFASTSSRDVNSARDGFVSSGQIVSAKEGFSSSRESISSAREGFLFSARDGLVMSARDGFVSAREGFVSTSRDSVHSAKDDYLISASDGVIVSSSDVRSAKEGYVSSTSSLASAERGLIVSARDGLVASHDTVRSAKEGYVISARDGLILSSHVTSAREGYSSTTSAVSSADRGLIVSAKDGFIANHSAISSAKEGYVLTAKDGFVSSTSKGVVSSRDGFVFSARDGFVSSSRGIFTGRDGFVSQHDTMHSAREGYVFSAREGYAMPSAVIASAAEGINLSRNFQPATGVVPVNLNAFKGVGLPGAAGGPGGVGGPGGAGGAGGEGAGSSISQTFHNQIRLEMHNHGGSMTPDDVTKAVKRALRRGELP